MAFLFQWFKFMKNLNKQKTQFHYGFIKLWSRPRSFFTLLSNTALTVYPQAPCLQSWRYTLRTHWICHWNAQISQIHFLLQWGWDQQQDQLTCSFAFCSSFDKLQTVKLQMGQTNPLTTISVKLIHCMTPQQGKMCSENMQNCLTTPLVSTCNYALKC